MSSPRSRRRPTHPRQEHALSRVRRCAAFPPARASESHIRSLHPAADDLRAGERLLLAPVESCLTVTGRRSLSRSPSSTASIVSRSRPRAAASSKNVLARAIPFLNPRATQVDLDAAPGSAARISLGEPGRVRPGLPGSGAARRQDGAAGDVSGAACDEPVFPDREADRAAARRAAERRDQAVVPAAAQDRVLRAQVRRDDLEDRARVVVEPAHERRLVAERNARFRQ